MSVQTITSSNSPLLVANTDTYVSTSATEEVVARLPEVDDGTGSTVAVGTEIRFEATGGSPIRIETFDRRLVGRCPGRGQAVVVAEAGAQESEDDTWRFQVLPQSPATHIADASTSHALNATFSDTEVEAALDALGSTINSILTVLEDAGLVKVE